MFLQQMCDANNGANITAAVPMLAAGHDLGLCQAQLAPHMDCSASADAPPPA